MHFVPRDSSNMEAGFSAPVLVSYGFDRLAQIDGGVNSKGLAVQALHTLRDTVRSFRGYTHGRHLNGHLSSNYRVAGLRDASDL